MGRTIRPGGFKTKPQMIRIDQAQSIPRQRWTQYVTGLAVSIFVPFTRRLTMKRKASKARSVEQIIRILRQADGGQTVAEICPEYNIAEETL